MGHHYITELPNEKYVFSKRGRVVTGLIMLLGLLLAGIGASTLKKSWHSQHNVEEIQGSHVEHHDGSLSHSNAHSKDLEEHHTHSESHLEGHHTTGWLSRVWASFLVNAVSYTHLTLPTTTYV